MPPTLSWLWIVELLLKCAILQAGVLTLVWFLRRSSAATRHRILACGFGAVLLVPLLLPVVPAWNLNLLDISDETSRSLDGSRALSPTLHEGSPKPDKPLQTGLQVNSFGEVRLWLFVLWILGALAVLIWLLGAFIYACWIGRNSKEVDDSATTSLLLKTAGELALSKNPTLRVSNRLFVPVVSGLIAPTIILPERALSWTRERQKTILLHELAHILRKDLVIRVIARLSCALFWFNPFIWVMERRLMIEGERACDDLVLNQKIKPSQYAEHLLRVSEELGQERRELWGLAPMAEGTDFKDRIVSILDPNANRSAPKSFYLFISLSLGVLLALPVAALSPWIPPERAELFPTELAQVGASPVTQATETDSQENADSPSLARLLNEIVDSDDSKMKEHAAQAAGQRRDKSSVPALLQLLQDSDPGVREHAATALGNIGDLSAVPALIERLGDENPRVREHVASALGQLRDKRSVRPLTEALAAEESSQVKRHILEALAEIG